MAGLLTRPTLVRFVSNTGVVLTSITIVLPLLRPDWLITWEIAVGVAVTGAAWTPRNGLLKTHYD